jgi:hypothetical protein
MLAGQLVELLNSGVVNTIAWVQFVTLAFANTNLQGSRLSDRPAWESQRVVISANPAAPAVHHDEANGL